MKVYAIIIILFLVNSCDSSISLERKNSATIFTKVGTFAVGGRNTCVITTLKNFYCWGSNTHGQVGNSIEDTLPVFEPALILDYINTPDQISSVAIGYRNACLLSKEGSILCWGQNATGAAGISDILDPQVFEPTPINITLPFGEFFKKVDSDGIHACGLTSANDLYCWGSNDQGQLGIDSLDPFEDVPTKVDTSSLAMGEYFIDIAAGYLHNCALSSLDKVYCWGINTKGEVGNSTGTAKYLKPVLTDLSALGAGEKPIKLYSGYFNNCIISNLNKTYCWGSNPNGNIGIGVTGGNYNTPTLLTDFSLPNKYFKSLAMGFYFSCGIANNNLAYCWGRNNRGQLANGSLIDENTPAQVMSSIQFKSINVGDYHSCALSVDDQLYCWGSNQLGQMGNNASPTSDFMVPTLIDIPPE